MTIPLTQFQADARAETADTDHRLFMQRALRGYVGVRAGTESRFADYESARIAASEIKWEAIENLAEHLELFADNLEKRGTKVHWCSNSEEARAAIRSILEENSAKTVIKSKCMTTEEIHLNEHLEAEGYQVVESDLGEFIVQLRKEAPYHFVFPAMHLRREAISDTFHVKLGSSPSGDPEELTMIARRVLRQKYIEADVGISGANFGIAETGMISITENEGNARLTTALPKIHIAVMGIEKVIPRLEDLALLLPMLATAGTGQHLTCYNSQFGGPRQPGEVDGPEQMHVILLDNHRTRLLADPEQRDALRCIRCGACLNDCPIFKNVGGHTYGTTYQGPIGSVFTPHLRGLKNWNHLSHSSSLCGACTETCPVKIDLHHHLLRNRRNAASAGHGGFIERMMMKGFSFVMRRPGLYRFAGRVGRVIQKLTRPIHGTFIDPLKKWRATREMTDPADQSFKEYWQARSK